MARIHLPQDKLTERLSAPQERFLSMESYFMEYLTHCYQSCFSEFLYHVFTRLPSNQIVATECTELLLNNFNALVSFFSHQTVFMVSFVFITSYRKIVAYLKIGNNCFHQFPLSFMHHLL